MMDTEEGAAALAMHGTTVSIGGATGTLVMVEGGGMALHMHEETPILQNTDGVKLEPINVNQLGAMDPETSEALSSGALINVSPPDGSEMVQALPPGVLPDPTLGEELSNSGEISLGEQYVINTGDITGGYIGVDGSGAMLSQAYVPVMMDMESQDYGGMALSAQIVEDSSLGQRVIILAPGATLPGGLSAVDQSDAIKSDDGSEAGDLCEGVTEDTPPTDAGGGDPASQWEDSQPDGVANEGVSWEEAEPSAKKIKLEHEDGPGSPLLVLTMPENGEEVMETTEEVISNVCKIALDGNDKPPSIRNTQSMADTDVTQAWFTTKDDKLALQNKGHNWKQGQWTKEEIEVLDHNIAKYCMDHNIQDPADVIFNFTKEERKDFYRTVARGLHRPLFSVYRRVIRMYDQKNHIGKYTPEEILKLKELRAKHGTDWATIGASLGRSASSVKDRCRLMRDTCNSGKWLPDEERLLAQAVYELSGCTPGDSVTKGLSWAAVAEKVGTRSEKQCRTKWLNYLNWKQLGGTEWTREDDIMLINKLILTEAMDETRVDWNELSENWPSARSPQWLRGKWWTLKRHVPDYQNIPLHDLLQMLKKVHYPKSALKSSLAPALHSLSQPIQGLHQGLHQQQIQGLHQQPIRALNKVALQQLGVNMAIVPVSNGHADVTSAGAVDTLVEAPCVSQGLEIYQHYPVMSSSAPPPPGTFLITPATPAPTIALTGTSLATDHIIVHTLPLNQEGVIRPPEALQDGVPVQQVVMTTGEGDNACLTPGIQLDHIDHADNDLEQLAEATGQMVPGSTITQSQLEIASELTSQISVQDITPDITHSDLEIQVALPGVTASPQFVVQTNGNDFIENMSSLSDPMLPSESADLIGSCSDTETDKPHEGDANS